MPDTRTPAAIGREARMDLVFERRGARTTLAHAYIEPPFRIGPTHDLHGAAYVIVACTGPGVFTGDRLRQTIRVGRDARVVLTSQSALQLHPSASEPPARIVHEYDVETGGELYAHWDPAIPFADARLDQRLAIRAADTSSVYWSDGVMSGRVAHGEAWRFASFAHELEVRRGDALAYLERYRIEPARQVSSPRWGAGASNFLSTALMLAPRADAAHAEAIQRRLAAIAGVAAGVDAVEAGLIVSRLAAAEGPPFAAARGLLRDLSLELIFERPNLLARK